MADATDDGDRLKQAAEAIGHALGRAVGLLDATRGRTKELVADAGDALAAGEAHAADITAKARAHVHSAAAVVRRTTTRTVKRASALKKSAGKAVGKGRVARKAVTAARPAKKGATGARRPTKAARKTRAR
jgi:hypothetical protein